MGLGNVCPCILYSSSESCNSVVGMAIGVPLNYAHNVIVQNPTVFSGNGTEDCGKWMRDYERIAKSNCWDTTMKLANAPFFLEGTAGQ
ncbi:hypothetical protein LAZ67_2006303 [Cordylochernes scorpioides]|uniref:Uncharacterized protein n=1 Tax=Cordylochernes scorpioides TaxID=51811 RepID=A0ABY6K825_9ARAC|nr:hypothetical protein LAZ67_2006303 [Cordylochernes scorpioides]